MVYSANYSEARATMPVKFFHPARAPVTQRGFTLIEIMVVIVIIGILSALVAPQVIEKVDEARVTAATSDIKALEGTLQMYKLKHFKYPETGEGLQALVSSKDLSEVPIDPWKNPYQYLNPGQHKDVDIYSFGADGQPGGEGVDADIGNWRSGQ